MDKEQPRARHLYYQAVNTCPKFVRIILDLSPCKRDKLMPFVRLSVAGYDRKEIIVAQHIAGSRDLYIAVALWPHDVCAGKLEVGMLGCGDQLGAQLEDKRYSVFIDQDTLIYVQWGGKMDDSWTGEPLGQRVALFINESEDKEIIGVLGNIPELGEWDPDNCPDETGMEARKGLSLCSVPLDFGHPTERNVEFKLVVLVEEENRLAWEEPSFRNKHFLLPPTGDVVVWSRWCGSQVQTTHVQNTMDLTTKPRTLTTDAKQVRGSSAENLVSNKVTSKPKIDSTTSDLATAQICKDKDTNEVVAPHQVTEERLSSVAAHDDLKRLAQKKLRTKRKSTNKAAGSCDCSTIELLVEYYYKSV